MQRDACAHPGVGGRRFTGSGACMTGMALTSYTRNDNNRKRSRMQQFSSTKFSYNYSVLVLGPTSIFLPFVSTQHTSGQNKCSLCGTDVVITFTWSFNAAAIPATLNSEEMSQPTRKHVGMLQQKFSFKICWDKTKDWGRLSFHQHEFAVPHCPQPPESTPGWVRRWIYGTESSKKQLKPQQIRVSLLSFKENKSHGSLQGPLDTTCSSTAKKGFPI